MKIYNTRRIEPVKSIQKSELKNETKTDSTVSFSKVLSEYTKEKESIGKDTCTIEEPDFDPFIDIECLNAVRENGLNLKHVYNKTPYICLEAVKQNPHALLFVHTQTEAICLEAVKQNGLALQYVKEQTPDVIREAIKNNEKAKYFVNPELKYLLKE